MVFPATPVQALQEAAPLLPQQEGDLLAGRGYLVVIRYGDRTTFDYYDFAADGTFTIWTLEGEGEGTYSVKNNFLFKARFKTTTPDGRDWSCQLKGFIFSKRVLFGEGEEYGSDTGVERYYFIALNLDATNQYIFMSD